MAVSFQHLVYPFSAIVGQSELKLALLLNAINPRIGGLLIRGQKGTGKSTTVRALGDLLLDIAVVKGCPFNCSPTDPTNMCPNCMEKYQAGEALEVERRKMGFVTLPIGATEDRVIGSLDIEKAIGHGVRALQPGLLAEANQNILYIDEVNLLPDHITDSILDAAASGWNIVEREGISVQHPSRFVLIGTMNPEEGELRPQILDRFGVYAETRSLEDPSLRALVIQRNEEFATDPYGFTEKYREELRELRSRIEGARKLLPEVEVPKEMYFRVAAVCSRLRVDGFRPDIVAMKAAKALAAFHGRRTVAYEEVAPSIELALGHRTRRSGLAPPPSPTQIRETLRKAGERELKLEGSILRIKEIASFTRGLARLIKRRALINLVVGLLLTMMLAFSTVLLAETLRSAVSTLPLTSSTLIVEGFIGVIASVLLAAVFSRVRRRKETVMGMLDLSKITFEAEKRLPPSEEDLGTGKSPGSAEVKYGKEYATTPDFGLKILKSMESLQKMPTGIKRGQLSMSLKRRKTVSSSSRGRSAWYQNPKGRPRDIALVPTLRVAALQQRERGGAGRPHLVIVPQDLRVNVREYRPPFSIILLVDMSMSMISSMNNIIQAIYSLHSDVYRRRDRVGLIVFKGAKAFTVQHPTTNLDLVVKKLKEVGASDFTPMAAGLLQAWKVLKQEKMRNRDAIPNLVVITDGIVNVPLEKPLSPLTRRKYSGEAQADAVDAAHLIAKEKFKVHIINTNHLKEEAEAAPRREAGWRIVLTPTQFLMELARISGGNYHGLSLEK